jgi:hypothetical protein
MPAVRISSLPHDKHVSQGGFFVFQRRRALGVGMASADSPINKHLCGRRIILLKASFFTVAKGMAVRTRAPQGN